jgi:hypothetical protein
MISAGLGKQFIKFWANNKILAYHPQMKILQWHNIAVFFCCLQLELMFGQCNYFMKAQINPHLRKSTPAPLVWYPQEWIYCYSFRHKRPSGWEYPQGMRISYPRLLFDE